MKLKTNKLSQFKQWVLFIVVCSTSFKFYIRFKTVPYRLLNHCIVFDGLNISYSNSSIKYVNDLNFKQYCI